MNIVENDRERKRTSEDNEKERTIERIEIIVTINNLKKGYTWYQLSNLKNQIIEKVESYFNFDWSEYGSKWGFEFYQAKKEKL